jgi:hypothetical protein
MEQFISNGRLSQVGVSFKGSNTPQGRKRGYRWAVFQCQCGNRHIAQLYQVKHGRVLSCGCAVYDSENRKTHGMTGTKEHFAWKDMLARCSRESHVQFKDYGGRGISVCDRWKEFSNFFEDMGVAPAGTSIDRKNNNGGYSKENCRWATRKEQNRNRRNNILVTIDGVTQCATDWAIEYGISPVTALFRINKGVDPSVAVSAKPQKGKKWNSDH